MGYGKGSKSSLSSAGSLAGFTQCVMLHLVRSGTTISDPNAPQILVRRAEIVSVTPP